MLCLINRFRRNESGATATEYAQTLGNGITDLFNRVNNTLTTVNMPTP
jgi:Flp pilus assembly pilin Flp